MSDLVKMRVIPVFLFYIVFINIAMANYANSAIKKQIKGDTAKILSVFPTSLVTHQDLQKIELEISPEKPIDNAVLEVWQGGVIIAKENIGALKKGQNKLSILLASPKESISTMWVLKSKNVKITEETINWSPPRHWTLYVLKSSHMDIGLHKPMYMERQDGGDYIELATKFVDATENRPDASKYHYMIEGQWWWNNFAPDFSEKRAAEVVNNYIKPGKIALGMSSAGSHTHSFGNEELVRSTYYAKRFKDRWGFAPKAVTMTDNNGISWPLVSAYKDAGIKYLTLFPNQWNPPPSGGALMRTDFASPIPHLFYWSAPNDTTKLLVWTGTGYVGGGTAFGFNTLTWNGEKPFYRVEPDSIAPIMSKQLALLERKYPYDIWLLSNYIDNHLEVPNLTFSNVAQAWNKKWRWPEFRGVGDLAEPFEKVEAKFAKQIPTLKGVITASWAQHPLAAAGLLAQKKQAHRLLPTAEKLSTIARIVTPQFIYPTLAINRAWEELIIYDEHSYGVSVYAGRRLHETWLQKHSWLNSITEAVENTAEQGLSAIASQVTTDGPSIMVFNPTLQKRTDVISLAINGPLEKMDAVVDPTGNTSALFKSEGKAQFVAKDIPPMGYAIYRLVKGKAPQIESPKTAAIPILENEHYLIKFNEKGAVQSILDKDISKELIDQKATFGFNQFVYTKDAHKTFSLPIFERFAMKNDGIKQIVEVYLTDPASGAAIVQTISLPNDEKRIDVYNQLRHVTDLADIDLRYYRYGYYAFPFSVSNPTFKVELNGFVADAYKDQTGLTTNSYHAANDWVHVGNDEYGVGLVQYDSHLVEFGKIHENKSFIEEKPTSSHVYSYLFNDWVNANAQETGPSHMNFDFRYSIVSHKEKLNTTQMARFTERLLTPVLAKLIPEKQKGQLVDKKKSFLTVDAPNINLLALKMSDVPGRGVIARFVETGGSNAQSGFENNLNGYEKVTHTTTAEVDLGALVANKIETGPFGYYTVRLENKSSVQSQAPIVKIQEVTEQSASLTWTNPEEDVQFNIYRADFEGFEKDLYHFIATVRGNVFNDVNLKSDKSYFYKITGVTKDLQESKVSLACSIKTKLEGNLPPLGIATHYNGLVTKPFTWRSDDPTALYIQWGQNQESDLSHYELYRGVTPDFEINSTTLVTKVMLGPYVVVSYEDTGLLPHKVYYYRVRAVDFDGNRGKLSDVFTGITRETTKPFIK